MKITLALLYALVLPVVALAAPANPDTKVEANRLYAEGLKHYQENQWADALEFLNRSAMLRPHPWTLYNIGMCERAMGRYLRARQAFVQAQSKQGAFGGALSRAQGRQLEEYLQESERMVAHIMVKIEPISALIAVNGRPLESSNGVYLAGTRNPGPGEPLPSASFEMLVDAGSHTLILSGAGLQDQVLRETFAPGQTRTLALRIDQLPSRLQITADRPGAIAEVDGGTRGLSILRQVPLMIEGDAGRYQIKVRKPGFIPYQAQLMLRPGQVTDIKANLPIYKPPLYKKWWFWVGGVAILGGIAGLTAGLATPPPPYDGGSTGVVLNSLRAR